MNSKEKEINETVTQINNILNNIKEKKASNALKKEELNRKEEIVRKKLQEKRLIIDRNNEIREKLKNLAS